MANYTLEEVTSRRAAREFLDLPKRLYRDEPHWICPLDSDIENRFRPQTNELLHDGEAIRWIALDERGRAVGRIAAFYNRELVKASEYQPTGGCGFFESIDDQRVADLLFDAARDWLAARGLEAMDGPINFGDRDSWWGLLVKGFEFTPLYCNPYNFEYYVRLFENYGFQNYFNQHTYLRELAEGLFPELQKFRFLWRLKVTKKATRIFALIFGVVPEFQGKGIESGMIYTFEQDVAKKIKFRYKSLELAWIGDFNPVMMRMVENYVCAQKHKMHTTYRYLFDRTKEFKRAPRMNLRKREPATAAE